MQISTDDINGQTNFYYKKKGVVVPESWRKMPRKNWPKKVMVAMGISWRGKSRIYIVPSKVKVNADAFIKFILKPMIEKDIKALYGPDAKKVVFHMDSAPAHTADKTKRWLSERNITYIHKEEWMANSPDLAPLDYAINSIFKRILKSFLAEDEKQLARIVRREWKKFPISVIRRALRRWKERVQAMIANLGYQFEHVL